MRNKIWLILAIGLVILALFGEHMTMYDPYEHHLEESLCAPGGKHLLGTDLYGRDVFSRVIAGAGASILSALLLVGIVALLGTVLGIICGYLGGMVDKGIMWIANQCLAFPGMVLAIAFASLMGGGLRDAIFALAMVSWPKYTRIARTRTLAIKKLPFMDAAKLAGESHFQMMLCHILPNILSTMLITATLDLGTMMMELAGMSFLGLGVKPPVAEWGSMINENRGLLQIAPWVVLSPGIAIFISVFIFNKLGESYEAKEKMVCNQHDHDHRYWCKWLWSKRG